MVEIQSSYNDKNITLIVVEDIEVDDNKEIVRHKTYHLRPKSQIKIEEFTDYGIFKPIRIAECSDFLLSSFKWADNSL